jgi:hypothetical protein
LGSAINTNSLATLIVNGQLVNVPVSCLGDLFEDLIDQELSNKEFLEGRSYLCEAHSQLNNLYSQFSETSSFTGLPGPSSGIIQVV